MAEPYLQPVAAFVAVYVSISPHTNHFVICTILAFLKIAVRQIFVLGGIGLKCLFIYLLFMKEQEIFQMHIVTHPERYDIARMLLETSGMFIGEIAKKLGYDTNVTNFHLRILERYGFIETKLRDTGKETPVMARFATPTELLYKMKTFITDLA